MAEISVQHAQSILDAGRTAEALKVVGRRLAIDPDDVAALCVASDALRALHRSAEAVETAERATRIDPQYAEAWNTLAFARLSVKNFGGALDAALRCVNLSPEDWWAHANLAVIASARDPKNRLPFDAALEAVRRAPNSSEAHRILGAILLGRNDSSEAIASFTHALRLDPHNRRARHDLAVATMNAGRPASAVAELARLSAESPNDALTYRNFRVGLGNILRQIHRTLVLAVVLSSFAWVSGRDFSAHEQERRIALWIIAAIAVGVVAFLAVRARRELGTTASRIVRYVVESDRLILTWALTDAIALVILAVGPALPLDAWRNWYPVSSLLIVIGFVIRSVRARVTRRALRAPTERSR